MCHSYNIQKTEYKKPLFSSLLLNLLFNFLEFIFIHLYLFNSQLNVYQSFWSFQWVFGQQSIGDANVHNGRLSNRRQILCFLLFNWRLQILFKYGNPQVFRKVNISLGIKVDYSMNVTDSFCNEKVKGTSESRWTRNWKFFLGMFRCLASQDCHLLL